MSASDKRAEARRKALEAVLEKALNDLTARGPTPIEESVPKQAGPTRPDAVSRPGTRQRPVK